MRETMASQPALLRELIADGEPCRAAAERVRGRRVLIAGTGTSWHAANQGAWLLRAADVETSEPERSSTFTASHLGALMRVAQFALALGADLGRLDHVPDAVEAVLDGPGPGVEPPARLMEFTGAGPNQWTAAEGALKVRETCYVAAEGLSVEQFFHGPSVAIDGRETLVCLDGGGPGAERLRAVA